MDHDLLLDLRHLDDPEPPRFGALRAEEAARRAALAQTRRARMLAGAALAVTLVVGVAAAAIGTGGDSGTFPTANPPLSTITPATETADPVPTAPPPAIGGPAADDPAAPLISTTGPPPVTSTPAPSAALPGVAAPAGGPSSPGAAVATTAPPNAALPVPPPTGTVAAPAGTRLTLTLDSNQMVVGGALRGVVRFENDRATAVTLDLGPCRQWLAILYQSGQIAGPRSCAATQIEGEPSTAKVSVPPGTAVTAGVELQAGASLAPGMYAAFTTVHLDDDGITIHSEARSVRVTRP